MGDLESGIYHHAQVKELAHYANGFLVGSSHLMEETDLDMACRKTDLGYQNKVCGLTRAEDAQARCRRCGVWWFDLWKVAHDMFPSHGSRHYRSGTAELCWCVPNDQQRNDSVSG